MEDLQLKIVSPEKIHFDGKVYTVQLPGTEGTFSILHNHAPIISSLQKGNVIYQTQKNAESQSISVTGGFVEVNKNEVTVCIE